MKNNECATELFLESVRQKVLAEEMDCNESYDVPSWYPDLVKELKTYWSTKRKWRDTIIPGADTTSPWYKKAVEKRKDEIGKEIAEKCEAEKRKK